MLVLGACAADGDEPPPDAGEATGAPQGPGDVSTDDAGADDGPGGGTPQGGDGEPADGGTDEQDAVASHPEPVAAGDPYEPVPGEVRPNAKRLAARIVEGLTTYEVEETPAEVVGQHADGELAEQLLHAAAPLFHEDAWSRGEIVYPQLGGILDDATSVMVVVEQTTGLADGTVLAQRRTLDVRLTLRDGDWALDELASAGGQPVERPDDLPGAATAVLEDERIDLPDTAVWDIHRGVVDERLLTLMSRMADRTPYGVIVLDTGHPWEVFGTDRQSKHSMGQAVDIHRLEPEGPLVIDDRQEGSATHALVEWLYEQPELSEVGGPWALDGYGGRSFTDQLHQDHLHVGVGSR